MNKIKLAFAISALSITTNAYAMPSAVPAKWWDNMMYRLNVMADNPGFCQAHPNTWICD